MMTYTDHVKHILLMHLMHSWTFVCEMCIVSPPWHVQAKIQEYTAQEHHLLV